MDPASAVQEAGGLASLATLRRCAVSRHELDRAVREGRVIRVRHGLYSAGIPEGLAGLRAAIGLAGGVASHESAAVLWGLESVRPAQMWLTVPRNHSRTRPPGVTVVRALVEETEVRGGMRVTTPLRTVVDCARVLPTLEAVVIADSALRQGLITDDELLAAGARACGRGARRVRDMAALVDPMSGSLLESVLRVLLVENGLAPDRTQHPICDEDGQVIARVDFAYLAARLIVEADGFEFHSNRNDYRKDRRRANAYCRHGWRLLRFSFEDIRFHPDYVVDAVRHELAKPLPRDPSRARAA